MISLSLPKLLDLDPIGRQPEGFFRCGTCARALSRADINEYKGCKCGGMRFTRIRRLSLWERIKYTLWKK